MKSTKLPEGVFELCLSWPPTVNHYWKGSGKHRYICAEGKAYRQEVCLRRPKGEMILTPVSVSILAHPPDRKRRDLDNILKCIMDSLAHAQIYKDDFQVEELHVYRKEARKPGCVKVTVKVLDVIPSK